jgi:hypothetical protein
MKMKHLSKIRSVIAASLLTVAVQSQTSVNYQWAFNNRNMNLQGGAVDNRGITEDAAGNVYVTGFFANSADFDPSPGIYSLKSNGGTDIYLAKYTSTGTLLWANAIGAGANDQAYGIDLDALGNVYITGYFNNTVDFDPGSSIQNRTAVGNTDFFVAKYDPSGNYVFASVVGGTQADNAYAITVNASNVYLTGSFSGTVDFDPSPATQTLVSNGSNTDVYILHLDLNGNYINAVNVGGALADVGNGIVCDASNNVYLTGSFSGTADFDPTSSVQNIISAGNTDVFAAKYNSSLNYVYAIGMGGTSGDIGNSISVDNQSNIYICGNFNGTADFDPTTSTANLISAGGSDIFYAKYNSAGSYLFANKVGGSFSENAYAIKTDANKNLYITGPFYSTVDFDPSVSTQTMISGGGADIYLAKYDSLGNYIFANGFGVTGTDMGYALYVDASNDVLMSGQFGSGVDFDPSPGYFTLIAGGSFYNTFFTRYNSAGAIQMGGLIGDISGNGISELAQAIVHDASGNIYITGQFTGVVDFDPSAATQTLSSATNAFGAPTIDAFVAKYDGAGNYIWARSIGGSNADIGYDIKVDAANNVYLTGYFNSVDCDFDPSASTQTLATAGSNDVYLAKYDASGNYLLAINFGGTGDDKGLSIAIDATGNAYIGGYITGIADFDPSAFTVTLTSAGSTDGFFAKYNSSGAYVLAGLLGGTGIDQVTSIETNASNAIYVSGILTGTADFDPTASVMNLTSAGSQDVFFGKYNSTGTLVFAKAIGGTSTDNCNDMAIDGSGNFYIAGTFGNNNSDFDPNSGIQNLGYAGGGADVFFAKYDATGNYVYAKAISSTSSEGPANIIADPAGNVFLTGYINGVTDFDPGFSVVNIASNGNTDIFFGKYDVNGNYLYAYGLGSSAADVGNGITADASGAVYVVGSFNNTVDFDPASAVSNLAASNAQDMFIAKYASCSLISAAVSGLNNVLCNGDATGSASITASGGSGFTYTWSPAGGNSSNATGLSSGTYSVDIKNSCGSLTTQTLNISQPSALTLTAVPSTTSAICALRSVTLSANAAGGTGVISYSWTSVGSSSVIVVTPSVSTVYTVNVTDANGCSAFTSLSIVVNPNPSVTVSGTSNTLCAGQSATLTSSGALTYTWSTTSTGSVAVITPSVTSTYTILGADANNCKDKTTISIVVNSNPTISVVSSNSILCVGQTATLTAVGASTYSWSTSSSNTIEVVSPTVSTTYTLTGTNANNCTDSITVNISVNPNPTVSVVSSSTVLCAGQTATLTANGALTYLWSTSSTNTVETVSPTVTTSYTLTGTDINGCKDSTTITQNVSLCTGVFEMANSEEGVIIFPNPTSGSFNINLSSYSETTEIQIHGSTGELVMTLKVQNVNNSIDLNQMASGVYIVTIKNNNTSKNYKLIKN